jgi:hypothetical protein
MPRKYVSRTGFLWAGGFVGPAEVLDADHPAVEAQPDFFDVVDDTPEIPRPQKQRGRPPRNK